MLLCFLCIHSIVHLFLFHQVVHSYLNHVLHLLDGYSREYQLVFLLGVALIMKYVYSFSIEMFLNNSIAYCKLFNLVSLFHIQFSYSIWYVMINLFLWLVARQPYYNGPENIYDFNEEKQIYTAVANTKEKSNLHTLVVVFYADWSDICIYV